LGEVFTRVRLESHHSRFYIQTSGCRREFLEQRTMTTMNAIEITNG
jgi:hypothetical protein